MTRMGHDPTHCLAPVSKPMMFVPSERTAVLMRIALAVALAGLTLAGPVSAELVASWEDAQTLAREKGQSIVVDFFAVWCGPCKRFDQASEEDAALRSALEGVVLFKTDAEREGKELAEQFSVGGYPTYVVANEGGEVLGRWWGFESATEWMGKFEEVMSDPTTMTQKAERFAASPNASDAFILGRYHETREEYERAARFYAEALGLDPDHRKRYEDAWFQTVEGGHREGVFEYAMLVERAEAVLGWGDMATSEDLYYLARAMTSAARRERNPNLAAKYLTVAMERLASEEDLQAKSRYDLLAVDHALIVEKNPEKAAQLKQATLEEGWREDSSQMNAFAWWCFENSVNLAEAEEIARAAVDLADTDADRANILDTVAEICNARGNCRDAVSLIEQAIGLNPESEYLRKQLEKFQKLLARAD